ncbi:peptide chain release factor N(5)-glutamine methyltransferase [Phosphitispora sp. TUW77]|uniref:peptide chain release factor N(5)-glutamine methyltransferase n=1 Tax=Phosphitispora sp. TUW77 TaxID=3152361 RepID=UPI003AB67230
MPTVREVLAEAAQALRGSGIDTARLDAEVLLAFILNVSRTDLYIRIDRVIPDNKLGEYFSVVARRSRREPVAYITGEKEFMSLSFLVNRDVLIPRPETEVMVEWVIERAGPGQVIVDVGTGSGAIAVSIAKYLPGVHMWAVDISDAALRVARENAHRLGVPDKIQFLNSSLLDGIPASLCGKVDWIIANLPYIPSAEVSGLQTEVSGYEPYIALDGGADGLDLYRKLVNPAFELLAKGGCFCLEMGAAQTNGLMKLLPEEKWGQGIQVLQDYAGLDRFIVIHKKT